MVRLFTIALLITFLLPVAVFGQGPNNPGLSLNIMTGGSIEFNFDEISDFLNGIQDGNQNSEIRVGALGNWKLEFKTNSAQFEGTHSGNYMPLNNLGVKVVSTGTNHDDGSNLINHAKSLPLALDDQPVLLLEPGNDGNRGYGVRNAFSLLWEMGTRNGNMNNLTLIEQAIQPDRYELTIEFTLTSLVE